MEYSGILVLVVSFVFLLVIGVPIAYSIGISGILTMLVSIDTLPAFTTFAQTMASGLDSFTLLAIPFFILAGNIMNSGGIARRLIDFAKVLVGELPGGLAFVNVIANMLFGAISGSSAASASAIGSIMGPEMKKEGYNDSFSAAVNITSATTGLSIPPSNVLIVYSLASGGVSITALFLAGYVPGILTGMAIMLMALSLLVFKTGGWAGVFRILLKVIFLISGLIVLGMGLRYSYVNYGATTNLLVYLVLALALGWWGLRRFRGKSVQLKKALKIFVNAIPSLFMLVIVIGGIVAGIFTATEASAIAVLYSLTLAFIYKEVKVKHLPEILLKSVKTTSVVALLIAASIALSWIMSYENIPQTVSAGLIDISDNPFVILLIINLILLAVGVFMDMTPAVLIFTPIFLPVVSTQLGMDPVHFGIIMVLNLSVGLCTPPVGSVLFIGCSVAKVSIDKVIKPLIPLFLAMIVVLLLVTYIPELSLWLPGLFGF